MRNYSENQLKLKMVPRRKENLLNNKEFWGFQQKLKTSTSVEIRLRRMTTRVAISKDFCRELRAKGCCTYKERSACGRVKQKQLPFPLPSDSTQMRPP